MANAHITAAVRCSQFKGTARLLLFILANAASPGGSKDADKKILPLGYCKRKLETLMAALNVSRQQTVSNALKELEDGGAIKIYRKFRAASLFFVNLDWLKEHSYTDEEFEEFVYPALEVKRKAANFGETRVASGSDAEEFLPGYFEQREAANLANGKRLTSTTENVAQNNGKRLTGFDLDTTSRSEGFVPPAEAGCFTTASRETQDACLIDSLRETRDTLDPKDQSQEQTETDTLPEPEPLVPVHPAPQADKIPSTAPKPPKRVCGFCGGPLRKNSGECLKCGLTPLPPVEPPPIRTEQDIEREEREQSCWKCGAKGVSLVFGDTCFKCFKGRREEVVK